MSADFELEFCDTHVHLKHAPGYEITPENNERLWAALATFCIEHHCLKVLSTAIKPQRKMGTLGAYRSGVTLSETGLHLKIACVWEDYKTDDLTQFFENVSENRGTKVRFFQDKEVALKWLASSGGTLER